MAARETRSPSYPQIGLSRSLELLRRLYEGIHRGATGTIEAQQIMGFSGSSGTGLASLSALKRFGLIEGRDPTIRITDLGFRILEPLDAGEQAAAIRTAAFNPPIFAAIHADFGGKLPADAAIRAKLIREHGFTASGVESFIRSLRETMSLVSSDEFSSAPESVTGRPEHAEAARTIGDTTAKGTRSSTPAHEGDSLATDAEQAAMRGMTRAAFPLVEGTVYLSFPADLSADGYAELAEYLQIFLRRAERMRRRQGSLELSDDGGDL